MARVTIEYYGMDGTGATVTEAKKDAGAKITAALTGSYTPHVLTHKGYAILIWREPNGWHNRIIADPSDGIRTDSRGMGFCPGDSERDAIRGAQRHLAQLGWQHDDGPEAPEFLTDRHDRADFRSWAVFQLRHRAARAYGLNPNDAHSWAGRDPSRPDLAKLDIPCAV